MTTGVIRTFYDKEETKLKEEYFVVNRKREGIYKGYYENGQLKEICNYINNKLNGICREYHAFSWFNSWD